MTHDEIKKKSVCIVFLGMGRDSFTGQLPLGCGMRPGDFFQVTVDPELFSPTGEFVRFGENPGDELMGWQRADAVHIGEILGEWDGDKPPEMKLGFAGVTTVNP